MNKIYDGKISDIIEFDYLCEKLKPKKKWKF